MAVPPDRGGKVDINQGEVCNKGGEHNHGVQGGSYASVVDKHVGGRKKL